MHGVLTIALLVVLASAGCTQYVTPQRDVLHPVRIYVTDYGKHSSVILPEPAGGYGEFAYGDYDFFALGHKGSSGGVRALLASRKAALGYRRLAEMNNSVEALRATGAVSVIELSVEGSRAESVRQALEARYDNAAITPHFNPAARLKFVPDPERYGLFNTCNHVMRAWLTEMGCAVEGNPWASRFVVRQPPPR